MIVSAIKDLIEDYGRAKEDYIKNSCPVKCYRQNHFRPIESSQLRVGDIILLEENSRVPADCILVSSALTSHVYVDTKNLDGETNLKSKTVPPVLLDSVVRGEWKKVKFLSLEVKCEDPNGDMRSFQGSLKIKNTNLTDPSHDKEINFNKDKTPPSAISKDNSKSESAGLSLENLLLSDCLIRNTPWLTCLIVYSGEETKLRENMKSQVGQYRKKESKIFSQTKKVFLGIFIIQFALCATAAILSGWYESKNSDERAIYLQPEENIFVSAILRFFTWFIILQNFIPISLYVSLEVVQFIQAKFMSWDKKMRSIKENGDIGYTKINSSHLNEELAQVSYIFADKTGTLTQNSMVFRKCVIGGERYGKGSTESGIIRSAKLKNEDVKSAMRKFQLADNKERKKMLDAEKKGEILVGREKHVNFDQVKDLLHLLNESKTEVGQSNQQSKKEFVKQNTQSTPNLPIPAQSVNSEKSLNQISSDNKADQQQCLSKENNTSLIDQQKHQIKYQLRQNNKKVHGDRNKNNNNDQVYSGTSNSSNYIASNNKQSSYSSSQPELVREFLYCLALNNSVFPKVFVPLDINTQDQNENNNNIKHDNTNTSSNSSSNDNSRSAENLKSSYNSNIESGSNIKSSLNQPTPNLLTVAISSVPIPAISTLSINKTSHVNKQDDSDPNNIDHDIDDDSNSSSVTSEIDENDEAPAAEQKDKLEDKDEYNDPNSMIKIHLESSSPDETALTSFAAHMGFELYSRDEGKVRLRVRQFGDVEVRNDSKYNQNEQVREKKMEKEDNTNKDSNNTSNNSNNKNNPDDVDDAATNEFAHSRGSCHFEDFEEVCVLEYNSKRKRMTVVMRPFNTNGEPADHIKIYCKGADSSVFELVGDGDENWHSNITPALNDFGEESLRSLAYAYSKQPANWFDKFQEEWKNISNNQGEKEKGHSEGSCSKECSICQISDKIEKAAAFQSLGVSGIEDALQQGVPNAIHQLLKANIQLWVLTGDNPSTAINIAISCNLLETDMEDDGRLFRFDKEIESIEDLETAIEKAESKIKQNKQKREGVNVSNNRQHYIYDINIRITNTKSLRERHPPWYNSVDVILQSSFDKRFGLILHGSIWKIIRKNCGQLDTSGSDESSDDNSESDESSDSSTNSDNSEISSNSSSDESDNLSGGKRKKSQQSLTIKDENEISDDISTDESDNSNDSESSRVSVDKDESVNDKDDNNAEYPLPKRRLTDNLDENETESSDLLIRFFNLCTQCTSVIACRLEPKEKSDIVDCMRAYTGKTCLAVGDGNNDTPMIKRADIGVAIEGVEGTSAVSASDYSLVQFRFLTRLLLVHGRHSHRRIAILVLYMFFKSAFTVWILFFYGILTVVHIIILLGFVVLVVVCVSYSQFSGQVFILDWAFQLHSILYTALPILVFAVFDKDLTNKTLEKHPSIYPLTRYSTDSIFLSLSDFFHRPRYTLSILITPSQNSNLYFSYSDFFQWMILSLICSLICFFLPCFTFDTITSPDSNGQSYGQFELGLLIYICVVITSNIILIFIFASWTYLHFISILFSIFSFLGMMAVFSSSTIFNIGGASMYYSFYRLIMLPNFYLSSSLSIGICCLIFFTWIETRKQLGGIKYDWVWIEAQKFRKIKSFEKKEKKREDKERKKKQQQLQKMQFNRKLETQNPKSPDSHNGQFRIDEDEKKSPSLSPISDKETKNLVRSVKSLTNRVKKVEEKWRNSPFEYTPGIRAVISKFR